MANTISVDLDTLPVVINGLQAVASDIASQQSSLNGLYTQLQEAVSGGASVIATFDSNVSTMLTALNSVETTLNGFVSTLNTVLNDAQAAAGAL